MPTASRWSGGLRLPAAELAQASVITCQPSTWIEPPYSDIGMKSAGDTAPSSGCFQRSSASTPRTTPVPRSTIGW